MPKWLLYAEGGVVLAAALFTYHNLHVGWGWFLLLFFVPDLCMLGYLAGPRLGAAIYNVAHTYALPIILAISLTALHRPDWVWLPVVWIAHIGLDRMLGYGLKYPTQFKDTHLQRV